MDPVNNNTGAGSSTSDPGNGNGNDSGEGQGQGQPPTSGQPTGTGDQDAEKGTEGKPAAGDGDMSSLPDWAQAELKRARREAAKARTAPKDAAEQARAALAREVNKILNPDAADSDTDPTKLTERLTSAQNEKRDALVELAIYKMADKHGAHAGRLGDSRSFMREVGKLDPTADDFPDRLGEVIKAAVENNPTFKASGGQAPPARNSGGEFGGGPGDANTEPSIDDFRKQRRERYTG